MFALIQESPQNCESQDGDMKEVSSSVQNLVASSTWHLGFMYPHVSACVCLLEAGAVGWEDKNR
jgi:hypothetical protein